MSEAHDTTEKQRKTRLLTTSEAAQHIGIHPETLTKWALQGAVPYLLTPSGRRRYRIKDLNDAAARWQR